MDINPLDCACFSIGANVVFIIFAFKLHGEETPFRIVCQIDFGRARHSVRAAFGQFTIHHVRGGQRTARPTGFARKKNALSDLRAVLDWFHKP
jgi:hypothetical protein